MYRNQYIAANAAAILLKNKIINDTNIINYTILIEMDCGLLLTWVGYCLVRSMGYSSDMQQPKGRSWSLKKAVTLL